MRLVAPSGQVTRWRIQGIARLRAKPEGMPDRALLETTAGRVVVALTGVLVLGVAVGLALLWPGGAAVPRPEGAEAGATERCDGASRPGPASCRRPAGPAR